MSIVARFFPNGEFSQGVDTSHKRRDKQRRDKQRRDKLDPKCRDAYLQWRRKYEEKNSTPEQAQVGDCFLSHSGNKYYLYENRSDNTSLYWEDEAGQEHIMSIPEGFCRTAFLLRLTPLVYQKVESCETTKSRKKLGSMTTNMARNIRNAVYLMEQHRGGKDALSFLTLTLPGLSPQGLQKCCQRWDYMVKRFLDWLSKRLMACNLTVQYVYCTEIQTNRLEKRHEYAPHLHVVFRGRNGRKQTWAITPKQARKAWAACIAAVVDEPFERNALENLQRIKRSAARYLSKYMSKGKNSIPIGDESNPVATLRTQWGGMARGIARLLRRATKRFDSSTRAGEFLPCFIRDLQKLTDCGYIRYFKKGFICLHKCPTTGMEYGLHVVVGCLSQATYSGGLDVILASYAYLLSGQSGE